MLKTTKVIKHFGSIAEVARYFNVSDTAVSKWKEEGVLPERREFHLYLHMPDVFPPSISAKAA